MSNFFCFMQMAAQDNTAPSLSSAWKRSTQSETLPLHHELPTDEFAVLHGTPKEMKKNGGKISRQVKGLF